MTKLSDAVSFPNNKSLLYDTLKEPYLIFYWKLDSNLSYSSVKIENQSTS